MYTVAYYHTSIIPLLGIMVLAIAEVVTFYITVRIPCKMLYATEVKSIIVWLLYTR